MAEDSTLNVQHSQENISADSQKQTFPRSRGGLSSNWLLPKEKPFKTTQVKLDLSRLSQKKNLNAKDDDKTSSTATREKLHSTPEQKEEHDTHRTVGRRFCDLLAAGLVVLAATEIRSLVLPRLMKS